MQGSLLFQEPHNYDENFTYLEILRCVMSAEDFYFKWNITEVLDGCAWKESFSFWFNYVFVYIKSIAQILNSTTSNKKKGSISV